MKIAGTEILEIGCNRTAKAALDDDDAQHDRPSMASVAAMTPDGRTGGVGAEARCISGTGGDDAAVDNHWWMAVAASGWPCRFQIGFEA